jgi:hypothetical protein
MVIDLRLRDIGSPSLNAITNNSCEAALYPKSEPIQRFGCSDLFASRAGFLLGGLIVVLPAALDY